MLCQSGFRPAITLSSLSLLFWVITALSVRVLVCFTLSSLSLSFRIITAQSVRDSTCYHSLIIITIIQEHHFSVSPGFDLLSLYYHYHYHSGSSLLCQSGSRPAITLLSLSLSFWVFSVSACSFSLCSISIPLVLIKLIKYIIHSRLLFQPCTVKDQPSRHYSSSILTLIWINNIQRRYHL